ncbi:hypothetical protein O181_116519 [Austropuccinia psidii MF-1]|uniref:Uncharacterized protein n=1 Tax=Austropuccinia psidii MF-1 TaxID=1389203 RepID=A0A9Q3KBK9_9BASI|nr:hypothetical protein [Austropuccinia psidii MF-1]
MSRISSSNCISLLLVFILIHTVVTTTKESFEAGAMTPMDCSVEFHPKGTDVAFCSDEDFATDCLSSTCHAKPPNARQDYELESVAQNLIFHKCRVVKDANHKIPAVLAKKYKVDEHKKIVFIHSGVDKETGKPIPKNGVECPLSLKQNGLRVWCGLCLDR